jgi:hypothetical protein
MDLHNGHEFYRMVFVNNRSPNLPKLGPLDHIGPLHSFRLVRALKRGRQGHIGKPLLSLESYGESYI